MYSFLVESVLSDQSAAGDEHQKIIQLNYKQRARPNGLCSIYPIRQRGVLSVFLYRGYYFDYEKYIYP